MSPTGTDLRTLTLVTAPASLVGVRETLRDWQAGGLVSDFVWVPAQAVTADSVPGFLCARGQRTRVSVRGLSGVQRYGRIRVVALSAVLADRPASAEEFAGVTAAGDLLRRIVGEEFGGTPVTAVRATFAGPGAVGLADTVPSGGWTDVVLSPSDSRGPRVGTRPVDTSAPAELGRHLAAQIAALAGLWDRLPEGTLDGIEPAHTGFKARLARSFHRRLDGSAVETAVRERVLAVADGYPLPHRGGIHATYAENESGAVEAQVQNLWTKHGWVIRADREQHMPAKPRAISAGQALRMFFAFLLSALRGAPSAWLGSVVDSTKATVASTVQNLVMGGSGSAYNVVVGGVDSQGRPVGWEETVSAAEQLHSRLDDGGQPVHEDLSPLWRSFVSASLTLVDARQREQELPAASQGAQPAIVRTPEAVAPDPERPFRVRGTVAGRLGEVSVQPADVVRADEVGAQVQQLATDPQARLADASAQFSEMEQWTLASRASFVSRVGLVIAEHLRGRQAEVAQRAQGLATASGPDADTTREVAEQNRVLGVRMRIAAFAGLALTLLFALLSFWGAFAWWVFWILFAVTLLGSLAGAFLAFMRTQSELFRLIHREQKRQDDVAVDQRNLAAALRDLTRLGDAYGQYLRWADVVGAFVHRPFGSPAAAAAGHGGRFDDLPLSTGHAEYVVDSAAVDATARTLRSELFDVGWADTQWSAFLRSSAASAQLHNQQLAADPQRLFAETAVGPGSALSTLTRSLTEHGVDPRLGEAPWQAAMGRLQDPRHAATRAELLGRIADGAGGAQVSAQDFLGAVGQRLDPGSGAPELLDDVLLTSSGAGSDVHGLADEVVLTERSGFSTVLVHTQLSRVVSDDDLAFFRERSASVAWGQGDSPWSIAAARAQAQLHQGAQGREQPGQGAQGREGSGPQQASAPSRSAPQPPQVPHPQGPGGAASGGEPPLQNPFGGQAF